jgi:SAM-dependent MidA family methyltransferase
MLLSEIIRERIKNEGPVSFRDFMEMCLYYPELGYYTSSKERIGLKGDFYTSSTLTSAFGAMIGRQLEEMWQVLGKSDFTVVEYGAGTGQLCFDILNSLQHNDKFLEKLQYCIIERSPAMVKRQKEILKTNVNWYDHVFEISNLSGCIISNELIDNFPVHRVLMEDELYEIFVDYKKNFVEVLKPASNDLKNYLSELGITLPRGFRTEINLDSSKWIRENAVALKRGFILTIDYGYHSYELYNSLRRNGTLICYHTHHTNDDPYINIGDQDITSHVNFSALCHWGWKNGLVCCGLTNQASFLLSLGYKEYIKSQYEQSKDLIGTARREAMVSHTLLFDMGIRYKVLVQRKDVHACDLSGLQVA